MAQTLVNGTSVSWQNINFTIKGSRIAGITKIDYEASYAHQPGYGAGPDVISYGYGNVTYTASIEIYLDEWKKIYELSNGNPCNLTPFDITIDVIPTEMSVVLPYRDVINNVKFLKDGFSISQGDTKSMVTIPLMISGIERFKL